MWFVKSLCLFGVSFGVVFCAVCFAYAEEVAFASNPLWLSTTETTEGEKVQASTVVTKQDAESVSGTISFFSGGKLLGTSDFSLPAGVGGAVVSVTFAPEKGTHQVSAKITRAVVSRNGAEEPVQVTGEAKAADKLVVTPDNDRDKIADAIDADDDNDGISDADEKVKGTDPLKSEVQAVAGAASSSGAFIDDATNAAKDTSALVFARMEELRNSAANYFDQKLKEAEEVRNVKQEAAADLPNIEDVVVAPPKPLSEQVQDTSGLLEGIKAQAYKVLSYVFNNVYLFYIIIIVFVLWILRKIWRRHSLD